MTTSTRACDASSCGLVEAFNRLTQAAARVSWAEDSSAPLPGLPTNGTIRCPAHRAGWCHDRLCEEGFPHSTTEAAATCTGHELGRPGRRRLVDWPGDGGGWT